MDVGKKKFVEKNMLKSLNSENGKMAEWLKAADCKSVEIFSS